MLIGSFWQFVGEVGLMPYLEVDIAASGDECAHDRAVTAGGSSCTGGGPCSGRSIHLRIRLQQLPGHALAILSQ